MTRAEYLNHKGIKTFNANLCSNEDADDDFIEFIDEIIEIMQKMNFYEEEN